MDRMSNSDLLKRRGLVFGIILIIALIHIFKIGHYLPSELSRIYYSYFSDILLPFGFYFLLCITQYQIPLLKRWQVKMLISFLLPSFAETLQLFGIYALGSTFDPVDYVMYGIGSVTAAIIETIMFKRIFEFWSKGI